MSNKLIVSSLSKDFESIKKSDKNGVEYWEARELMKILGYEKWQNAEEVIAKAAKACMNSGQAVDNHFTDLSKMVEIGSNTMRQVRDWKLDRYACYLIAQNGDPKKPEIAMAQTYFAIQTRKQEIFEQLSESDERVFIRGEVTTENKKLFRTAKKAGVTKFGSFNDALTDVFGHMVSMKAHHRNFCLVYGVHLTPAQEIVTKFPLKNSAVRLINETVAQVTYISEVDSDGVMEVGIRSSIWSKIADGWQLRFHQGTPSDNRLLYTYNFILHCLLSNPQRHLLSNLMTNQERPKW